VKARKKITLRIPKGVETGARLRLAGKGEGGGKGGPAGDLYVVISVVPHDLFERQGDDLFCELPVPFETAALGGEVQAPTIDGYAKLKLAPGTETGRVFRLKGKGFPNVEGYGRGDLHVRVVAQIPTNLDARQKKLVRDLELLKQDSNYPGIQEFENRAKAFFDRKEAIEKSE